MDLLNSIKWGLFLVPPLNNEPRNALLLTFIIAEMGILIGELNVIAELVAMFYMAAYLFINISCFLEQWSSPDFRPKFKIPIAVSLIGAIATFLLMIQLNLAATLVAVIVMMAFWFWLSKKDLVLGTGDVWFSVWTFQISTHSYTSGETRYCRKKNTK